MSLRLFHILFLCSLVWPAAAQQWEQRTPMDQPRAGLAAVVLDGQVYLLGGEDQFGNVLDTAVRYDPGTGQWFPLPAMQTARVAAAAVVFAGRVFVLGGRGADGTALDDVEFYDPNDNRWRSFVQLNEKRQGLVAVATDTSIVVAGGSNEQDQILESVEVYTASQQSWAFVHGADPADGGSLKPLALTPRAALAAAGVGGDIFFVGGFSMRGPVDVVEQLQVDGTLEQRAPLPTPRGNLGAAAVEDSLYIIGGLDGTERVLGDVFRLDVNANIWEPMPRLIIAREGCAAVAVGEALYVFGGRDAGERALDDVEALIPTPTLPTTLEDEPSNLPDFALAPGYPNPFRKTTTLTITVSGHEQRGPVELAVYDIQGRRIAVLVDEALPPGEHRIPWEGTDLYGRPVGSGVYVARLRQGPLQAHTMMTILR